MVFAGTRVWKSKRGTPLLGCRCVFINAAQYGYNVRDEFISADDISYANGDIGVHVPTNISEEESRTAAVSSTTHIPQKGFCSVYIFHVFPNALRRFIDIP